MGGSGTWAIKMEYGNEIVPGPGVNGGNSKAAADSPSVSTTSLEISRTALEQFLAIVSITVDGVVAVVTGKR
jgi:hypothetical protein